MKKRILFFEEGIGFGGSTLSLSELVKGMLELEAIDAFILSDQRDDILDGLFPKEVRRIEAHRPLTYRDRFAVQRFLKKSPGPDRLKVGLERGFSALDLASDGLLARSVARRVRELRIDVVHCNNGWNYPCLLAAHKNGIPALLHYRQLPPRNPGRGTLRKLQSHQDTIRACIGISGHISEAMIRFGHDPSIVHTIHNPVDVTPFQEALRNRGKIRRAYHLGPDHVVFGIFGRITAWKGQLELLSSASGLLDRSPDMRIMIVGDSSDTDDKRYFNQVQELARTPPFMGKVIMTGYQSAVHDFYAAADVVVHNSTAPEPFGRVVIEGMASGRAVVAMDEGGPAEVLCHGHDGLLVEPRRPEPLAEAMERLYLEPELRARLGEAALRTVSENHNSREIAQRVLDLYP